MKPQNLKLDRFMVDTEQMIAIEQVFLNSKIDLFETILNPAITEFVVINGLHSTVFELLDSKELIVTDYQRETMVYWVSISKTPNGKCKCDFRTNYETIRAQAVEIASAISWFYAGVQLLSLHRPEVFSISEKAIDVPRTIKTHGKFKEIRETKMVRVIRLNKDELAKRHNTITCPCWGVAGHYRHYKNGKTVFIKSYRKGKHRDDPEAYSPKTYLPGGLSE